MTAATAHKDAPLPAWAASDIWAWHVLHCPDCLTGERCATGERYARAVDVEDGWS